MMHFTTLGSFCLLLSQLIQYGSCSDETHLLRSRRLREERFDVVCQLVRVDILYESPTPSADDEVIVCEVLSGAEVGHSFTIDLPDHLVYFGGRESPVVEISHCWIDHSDSSIQLSQDADVTLLPDHVPTLRRTQAAEDSKALVLRVNYRGAVPSLSRQELAGRIFGLGSEAKDINLASQLLACSAGKLALIPATGAGIQNGVADIYISKSVSGRNSAFALDSLVVNAAAASYGSLSQFQHVLLVFPDAGLTLNNQGFLAYASVGGWLSVYSDSWGGEMNALAHEIGHNLRNEHSGEDGVEYGDVTGYMGSGARGEIQMCFNAQKHWNLGWFGDRAASLDVNSLPWAGNLVFFGDYAETPPGHYAVVKIDAGPGRRLFMQYNLQSGINQGTREYGDQVVIVSDGGSDQNPYGQKSWLEGHIMLNGPSGVRDKYRENDFAGTGSQLVIRLCTTGTAGSVHFARMSLHLNDGIQANTCGQDIPEPSSLSCDDDPYTEFFVDSDRGYRNCGWLMRVSDALREELCVESHPAYDTCSETCGKCTDDCEDTSGVQFFVNDRHQMKDCEWISSRIDWREKLCVEGNDAYEVCRESCDRCDS